MDEKTATKEDYVNLCLHILSNRLMPVLAKICDDKEANEIHQYAAYLHDHIGNL
jgi:hypothetical protein